MFADTDYLFILVSQINFKADLKISRGRDTENPKLQHGKGERLRKKEFSVRIHLSSALW